MHARRTAREERVCEFDILALIYFDSLLTYVQATQCLGRLSRILVLNSLLRRSSTSHSLSLTMQKVRTGNLTGLPVGKPSSGVSELFSGDEKPLSCLSQVNPWKSFPWARPV
jgi:hypothetical protein